MMKLNDIKKELQRIESEELKKPHQSEYLFGYWSGAIAALKFALNRPQPKQCRSKK